MGVTDAGESRFARSVRRIFARCQRVGISHTCGVSGTMQPVCASQRVARTRVLMTGTAKQRLRTKSDRHTRESGYPVRRSLSFLSLTSLEYWVTRLRG